MITCENIPNCIGYEDCLLCPARNWLLFRFTLIEEGLIDLDAIHTMISRAGLYEQLAEEATELAHAALKMARKLRNENPTPMILPEINKYVNEEYTDVVLCAQILSISPDEELLKFKNERWNQRLKESILAEFTNDIMK